MEEMKGLKLIMEQYKNKYLYFDNINLSIGSYLIILCYIILYLLFKMSSKNMNIDPYPSEIQSSNHHHNSFLQSRINANNTLPPIVLNRENEIIEKVNLILNRNIEQIKEVNKKDYDRILNKYFTFDKIKKIRKERYKEIMNQNTKWKSRIFDMDNYKKQVQIEREERIKEEMKEKEENQIEKYRKITKVKSVSNINSIMISKQRQEDINRRLEENKERIEKRRTIIYDDYLNRTEKVKDKIEKDKTRKENELKDKNEKIKERIEKGKLSIEREREDFKRQLEGMKFSQFEKYYFYRREKEENKNKSKKEYNLKNENRKYLKEEIKKEENDKRNYTSIKINKMNNNIEAMKVNNSLIVYEKSNNRKMLSENYRYNRNEMNEDKIRKRISIISKQFNSCIKNNDSLSRTYHLRELNINVLCQKRLIQKSLSFQLKVNKEMSNSILKISEDKRKEIYKNLLKKALLDKKKREMEELERLKGN